MFAVIFEVHPRPGKKDQYLALAKEMKPILESMEGFIDNERFSSKAREGWVLSLSIWRDEKALIRWRTRGEHHGVQEKGRADVFEDYHLRVGEVTADSDPPPGIALQQVRFDETVVGAAKVCSITEITPAVKTSQLDQAHDLSAVRVPGAQTTGLLGHEMFESITNPGKMLLLGSWTNASAAHAWQPRAIAGSTLRHRQVRVVRDYGMFERREAPQYYPDAQDHRQQERRKGGDCS